MILIRIFGILCVAYFPNISHETNERKFISLDRNVQNRKPTDGLKFDNYLGKNTKGMKGESFNEKFVDDDGSSVPFLQKGKDLEKTELRYEYQSDSHRPRDFTKLYTNTDQSFRETEEEEKGQDLAQFRTSQTLKDLIYFPGDIASNNKTNEYDRELNHFNKSTNNLKNQGKNNMSANSNNMKTDFQNEHQNNGSSSEKFESFETYNNNQKNFLSEVWHETSEDFQEDQDKISILKPFTTYNETELKRNLSKFQQDEEEGSREDVLKTFAQSKKNSNLNSVNVQPCGLDVPRRIIGGTNTDIDEFPWLTLLQYWDSSRRITHECGGVLISKRYVVTAAHCTNGTSLTTRNIKLRKVRLGEWDLSTDRDCQGDVCSPPTQEIDVEEIIAHPGYVPRGKTQANDISLIRLRTEVELNQYVQPICLPFNGIGQRNFEGRKLTVSGWGRTSNARNSSSNVKKKVDVPVANWDRCRQFYQSFYSGLTISKNQFCAGGESGEDSCQGDSGGPLMTTAEENSEMHWYLIGIVSSGPAACGVENRPSLYTNVSQYTDWILQNMKS